MDLFHDLPDDTLAQAGATARVERLTRNSVIFEQGGRAERAYAVARGSVRIVQAGRDGDQAIIRFIAPGEMFGTVPLFTDHLLPADAIATEATIVLSWSEVDLLALIDAHPRLSINVIRIIGSRLLEVQDRVRELATQNAAQRLARALLRLCRTNQQDVEASCRIPFPLRRKDLAEFSGTTLYTASRTLAAWAKAGFLTTTGQYLLIHDCAALRALADGAKPPE